MTRTWRGRPLSPLLSLRLPQRFFLRIQCSGRNWQDISRGHTLDMVRCESGRVSSSMHGILYLFALKTNAKDAMSTVGAASSH